MNGRYSADDSAMFQQLAWPLSSRRGVLRLSELFLPGPLIKKLLVPSGDEESQREPRAPPKSYSWRITADWYIGSTARAG